MVVMAPCLLPISAYVLIKS